MSAGGSSTAGSGDASRPLRERYPGLVCDLDGVVYRGARAVPHAVESLSAARQAGARIVFATNNASRPPGVVAESLGRFGISLTVEDVLTSSIAGARQLADELPSGAAVLAIGGPGVREALKAAGLRPVSPDEAPSTPVDAVLQGYGPDVTAAELGEAAYAIQSGARWVATNDDLTLPTDRGVAPGNGSLVAAVRRAVDADPIVVGKPGPLLYELAARALGTDAQHTLGIGDRLETDVAGAHAAGMSALHVLTGVHGPPDLVGARPGLRPRFVAEDLQTLALPYPEPRRTADGRWVLAGVSATASGSAESLRIDWGQAAGADPVTWIVRLRLALRVLWEAVDLGSASVEQAITALPERR